MNYPRQQWSRTKLTDYPGNNAMDSLIEQLETQSDELSCPRWAKLETQSNGLIKYTGDIYTFFSGKLLLS